MKLTIIVVLTALYMLITGLQNPALFYIGYLWISVMYPSIFINFPLSLSMIFGLACLAGYFFIDKTHKGRLPTIFYLAIVFGIWVTFTTTIAERPVDAWGKWTWAIESILIIIASPIFLRTRVQIETAFLAILFAFAAHVLTAGIKTFFGTGGYSQLGTLMQTNFWLGETSTLALAAVMTIPMAYYAVNRSIILEPYRGRLLYIIFAGYVGVALLCMIGTSARTGLVALGVLLIFGPTGLFRKALLIACTACLFFVSQSFLPGKSIDRYGTVQDSSAQLRLGVWQWGLRYAQEHPLGGGFTVFYNSSFDYPIVDETGHPSIIHEVGAAPHSVYFEVLGEQGYFGELIYLGLLGGGILSSYLMSRTSRTRRGKGEQVWHHSFARTLFVCLLVFAAGASFVGIAFQPLLYLFLGLYCSVYRLVTGEHVRQPTFSAKPHMHAASV